jgi:TPP-dependent pyruvate/acetoin dehydrogenase alpha subunit
MRRYLERRSLWDDTAENQFRRDFETEVSLTLKEVERVPSTPPPGTLFGDVYARQPWHLAEQENELQRIRKSRLAAG